MKMRHQTHKDVPGPSREGDGLSSEEIGEDEDGEDTIDSSLAHGTIWAEVVDPCPLPYFCLLHF